MEQQEESARRSRSIGAFDGDKLRRWRKEVRTLSQVQLADAAGLSRGEISHLETGKRQPLATTLGRICVALECEPADLLTRSRAVRFRTKAKDGHAAKKESISA